MPSRPNWRLHSKPQAIELSRMNNIKFNRREFMQKIVVGSLTLPGLSGSVLGGSAESKIDNRKSKLQSLPAVRAITQGPKFHWFSYYDKLQFDPTGRYALGMEVDFEHRSPKADDIIKIGMVDLKNGGSRAVCSSGGQTRKTRLYGMTGRMAGSYATSLTFTAARDELCRTRFITSAPMAGPPWRPISGEFRTCDPAMVMPAYPIRTQTPPLRRIPASFVSILIRVGGN